MEAKLTGGLAGFSGILAAGDCARAGSVSASTLVITGAGMDFAAATVMRDAGFEQGLPRALPQGVRDLLVEA